MKKILAVLCSAVLTVAMTVTAFAQPSVIASIFKLIDRLKCLVQIQIFI